MSTNASASAGAPAPESPATAVDLKGISKTFGGTRALIDVTFSVAQGETRALVGRNGAGKSTLISLLTGLARPDRGEVRIGGRVPSTDSTGVGCVYQHSRLIPALTVAENLVLGGFPRKWGSFIDWSEVRDQAHTHLDAWGLADLSSATVESLDPVQRKVVEICRALISQPEVLLLDEPTAGLDRRDVERLFDVIRDLQSKRVTVVYVSHHLNEVYELCDSATVLRNARHILTAPLSELPMREMVRAMVSEEGASLVPDSPRARATGTSSRFADAETRLEVRDLRVEGLVKSFDVDVRRGECVGIAGIEGSGKNEVGAVIGGLLRPDNARVVVDGRELVLGDGRAALTAGVGYVPPDRMRQGFVAGLSVSENATMTASRRLARRWLPGLPRILRQADLDGAYQRLAEQWEIVASSSKQPAGELSGGNQQKCVMARGLATEPSVLVLQQPTAGVDVAAKASIMSTLEQVFDAGACGLIISEDSDDFLLCARILIMVNGEIAGCLEPGWTEEELVTAMQGAVS